MATSTNVRQRSRLAAALIAAAMLLAPARPAAAQGSELDPRWTAWLGCWEPEADESAAQAVGVVKTPLVCVIPATGSPTIDVLTVVDGKVASRQRVATTGDRRQVTREGCSGWERAQWAGTGTRVYLSSEFTCPGGVTRSSSGLIAISPTGKWLDLDGVSVSGSRGVRAIRYREASLPSDLPTEISSALAGRTLAVRSARAAAGSWLTLADIIDASRGLSPQVLEAWLVERRQGFDLDAKRLVQLADAGVSPSVIDVMVALSYPQTFAINTEGRTELVENEGDRRGDDRRGPYTWMQSDPFGDSRYGYSGYGYYPYGYYGGNRPVVIVRGSGGAAAEEHGRMVKGRGHTRDRGGSEPSTSRGTDSGGSSSGSAGGTKEKESSGGRTAKPRKP